MVSFIFSRRVYISGAYVSSTSPRLPHWRLRAAWQQSVLVFCVSQGVGGSSAFPVRPGHSVFAGFFFFFLGIYGWMELRIVKGFVVLILFSFLYIFFSDTLHIHCGFCCWTIHSVEYSRQGVLPSSPLFCVRACMCGWKRAREMSPFRAHMLCCFSSLFFFFFFLCLLIVKWAEDTR